MRKIIKTLLGAVLALQIGFFLPAQKAHADIVSELIHAVVAAAGWPTNLPQPDALIALFGVVQTCGSDLSGEGLLNCVEAADADPTIHAQLGDEFEKIKTGLTLYKDIVSGDILGVLEIVGEAAGCAVALVLTGVPACEIAKFVADVAGAAYDAASDAVAFLEDLAGAVGQALGLTGYQHIPIEDYYAQYWAPRVPESALILSFDGSDALLAFDNPIYNTCLDYFIPSNMKEDTARHTCDDHRNRMVAAAVVKQGQLQDAAKQLIGGAYQASTIGLSDDRCRVTKGVANAESLAQTCKSKIEAAIPLGKPVAMDAWKTCQLPATRTYDNPACVKVGRNFISKDIAAAAAPVQAANDAYASKLMVDGIAKNSEDATKKKLNDEVGVWYGQCPAAEKDKCIAGLNDAWNICQKQIGLIPQDYKVSAEFMDQNPATVKKVQAQCQSSYSALLAAYGSFDYRQKSLASLSNSCPQEGQGSGSLFITAREQCAKDVGAARLKCTGGQPQITAAFYGTGKITQTPAALDDCSGEINAFNGKWGVDEQMSEQINGKINVAAFTAANACTANGLPGCIDAVTAEADACKAKVSKQANWVGIVPGMASFQAELAKATKDLDLIGNGCVASVLKVPEKYVKSNAAEMLALQIYLKQCPQIVEQYTKTISTIPECKAELVKTIEACTSASSVAGIAPQGNVRASGASTLPAANFGNPQTLKIPGVAGTPAASGSKITTGSVNGSGATNIAMNQQQPVTPQAIILPGQQVEECKPKLQAVIDKYQKLFAAAPKAGAAAPSTASPAHGISQPGALTGPATTTQPKADATSPVRTAPGTPSLGTSAVSATTGNPSSGTPSGAFPALTPGTVKPPPAAATAAAAPAPVRMTRPDPFLYTQQRKPLLEAPWLTQCVSNGCRTEVSRLIGDRIRDELDAMGTRVNSAEARAVDALYRDLDTKYREPLSMALKKKV